jgi:hypothetical protein
VFVNQLPTATISLANKTLTVDRNSKAAIMLTCSGSAPSCDGTLTLTAQREPRGGGRKHRHAVAVVIGTASVSIPSGETTTVDVQLNHRGRKHLDAGGGHLPATLTLVKELPQPEEEQMDSVELVREKTIHP